VKRGGGNAGKKTPARGARGKGAAVTAAAARVEETVRIEEVAFSAVTEMKEEIKVEEIKIEEEKPSIEESKANGSVDPPGMQIIIELIRKDCFFFLKIV
jgi:hypothetical protein